MAKRPQKPTKKREPPWLEAARARLRGKGARRHDTPAGESQERAADERHQAVYDALLEMAAPDLEALGEDASDAELDALIGCAVLAYNQIFLDAAPVDEGGKTPGQRMREVLALAFEKVPAYGARFERMVGVRQQRFAHLPWPIDKATASWTADRRVRISIILYAEAASRARPAPLTGDDRDGPNEEAVREAILELAAPELEALASGADDRDLATLISLAVFAYNQPILESLPDHDGAPARATLAALEGTFSKFPRARARFGRMVALRKERFGHLTWMIKDFKARWGEEGDVILGLTLLRTEAGADP
jgi:hypothetical protein